MADEEERARDGARGEVGVVHREVGRVDRRMHAHAEAARPADLEGASGHEDRRELDDADDGEGQPRGDLAHEQQRRGGAEAAEARRVLDDRTVTVDASEFHSTPLSYPANYTTVQLDRPMH